ncbi:hypothetical protein [Catenuloplanes japonicus]|uniref:hypothetical protein n=1 Tax=Catenuloplanes japonicus TaxID=33876 RepID=UPI00068EEDD1|nr:hypothetical protein [Catenuloplanes japonicus]
MAVRIDGEAFRESVPADVAAEADRLAGEVGELESLGGGVQAEVAGVRAWVGIVGGAITGVCDCAAEGPWCAHAVALALTAIEARFPLLASAVPPGPDPADPEQARFLQALRRLTPRQLSTLVVEEALRDRLFAVRLLGEAGLLDAAAAASGAEDFRAAVRDASDLADADAWNLDDIEDAGERLVEEAEILLAYPASAAALAVVGEAIVVWDELAGALIDNSDQARTEPREVGDPLVAAHRELCERLGLDEDEIAARVEVLAGECGYGTIER